MSVVLEKRLPEEVELLELLNSIPRDQDRVPWASGDGKRAESWKVRADSILALRPIESGADGCSNFARRATVVLDSFAWCQARRMGGF